MHIVPHLINRTQARKLISSLIEEANLSRAVHIVIMAISKHPRDL